MCTFSGPLQQRTAYWLTNEQQPGRPETVSTVAHLDGAVADGLGDKALLLVGDADDTVPPAPETAKIGISGATWLVAVLHHLGSLRQAQRQKSYSGNALQAASQCRVWATQLHQREYIDNA